MNITTICKILTIGLIGLLAGCSAPKPFDFSLNTVSIAKTKIPFRLSNISVNVETANGMEGKKFGSRPKILEKFVEPLKNSLQDAVDKSALFDFSSRKFCSLDVKIIGLKYSLAGITFPTTLYVRYSIVNLDTGRPIFNHIIAGHGQTPFSYNFIAVVRSRHSIILSGQDNVRNFINSIENFSDQKFSSAKLSSKNRVPID